VDFATGAGPQGVEVRDIDGDGNPDLLVTNSGEHEFTGSCQAVKRFVLEGSLKATWFNLRNSLCTL
jgi:hypothetical protein